MCWPRPTRLSMPANSSTPAGRISRFRRCRRAPCPITNTSETLWSVTHFTQSMPSETISASLSPQRQASLHLPKGGRRARGRGKVPHGQRGAPRRPSAAREQSPCAPSNRNRRPIRGSTSFLVVGLKERPQIERRSGFPVRHRRHRAIMRTVDLPADDCWSSFALLTLLAPLALLTRWSGLTFVTSLAGRHKQLPAGAGAQNETSTPQILASGRGRCRAAGRVAHRSGANLSDTPGAYYRWLSSPANQPTSGTLAEPMAVGPAWGHRKPDRASSSIAS